MLYKLLKVTDIVPGEDYRSDYKSVEMGEIELPFNPAIHNPRKQRAITDESIKTSEKQKIDYCEKSGISLSEYNNAEKAENEFRKSVLLARNGIIVYKKEKYRILSIEITKNHDRLLYVQGA